MARSPTVNMPLSCRTMARPATLSRARSASGSTRSPSPASIEVTDKQILAIAGVKPRQSLLFLDAGDVAQPPARRAADQERQRPQVFPGPPRHRGDRAQALRPVAEGRRGLDRRRRRRADRQAEQSEIRIPAFRRRRRRQRADRRICRAARRRRRFARQDPRRRAGVAAALEPQDDLRRRRAAARGQSADGGRRSGAARSSNPASSKRPSFRSTCAFPASFTCA